MQPAPPAPERTLPSPLASAPPHPPTPHLPTTTTTTPQGIDTEFFDPAKYEPLSLKSIGAEQATGPKAALNATYVFLSIFKWEARKG